MTFQEKLIKKYTNEGYLVIKHVRTNFNGIPDLQLLKDGKSIFIEVKEGKDTIKPLQKFRINQLINLGFEAYCIHETKGVIFP
jgi:Holliday junction resolvase